MGWIAFINIALIALVAVGIAITQNPLCLMSLFFLRDMTPPQPMFMRMPSDDEEEGQPMGFTADL